MQILNLPLPHSSIEEITHCSWSRPALAQGYLGHGAFQKILARDQCAAIGLVLYSPLRARALLSQAEGGWCHTRQRIFTLQIQAKVCTELDKCPETSWDDERRLICVMPRSQGVKTRVAYCVTLLKWVPLSGAASAAAVPRWAARQSEFNLLFGTVLGGGQRTVGT